MKKTISIILIIAMLVLPFSLLLNVNATTQTTKGIQYDDSITNGNGYKVTSQSASGVVVNNIGANNTLGMYKILDVYYNPTSNQISYDFTSSFNTFAQAQSPQISVNDYLTSDTTNTNSSEFYDNSDFNELVSKYAMYVRANNVNATYSMTTSIVNGLYTATHTNTEAGIYLILPTSVASGIYPDGNFESMALLDYGVMIANVVPSAGNNDTWTFSQVEINAKKANTDIITYLLESTAANAGGVFTGTVDLGTSLNYLADQDYSYVFALTYHYTPENAHSSFKELESNRTLDFVDIAYPSSIVPDLTNIKLLDGTTLLDARIDSSTNKYMIDTGDGNEFDGGTVTNSNNILSFEFTGYGGDAVFDLDIDSSNLSNIADNTITATTYAVKDPYVDVGSNLTKADIRAAFDTNDANYSSAKSVNIRKGIEKIEKTVTFNVTGITINNTNSSNNNLSGGEFAVYSTYNNGTYSNQVGSNIVMTNGTGVLKGVDPTETYYLKQVKTPTGYRMYDDKIIVLKGTNDENTYDSNTYEVIEAVDGMYTANIVNSPMLALPFTGGSGTVVYTIIGLAIVVGAGIFLVLYKKKKPQIEEL